MPPPPDPPDPPDPDPEADPVVAVAGLVADLETTLHALHATAAGDRATVAALARVRDVAGLSLRLLGADPDVEGTDAAIDRVITALHATGDPPPHPPHPRRETP